MSRHFLQRWSVVFLLVSRLIFGELAHSAPHDVPARAAPAAEQSEQEPCTDHAGEADPAAPTVESVANADHDGAHDQDCCKATACECACVHVSALDAPSLALNLVLIDHARVPAFALGLAEQRPSALFRPPA